jgi:hypothetical protein
MLNIGITYENMGITTQYGHSGLSYILLRQSTCVFETNG